MRRSHPYFAFAFAGLGITLAACGPMPDDVALRESAIVGGVNDQGDPSVVLLLAQNNQGASLCTSEIVSPHVVLTAAHCVAPSVVGNVTFSVFLGYDINDRTQANNQANYYQVRETHYDPKFNVNNLTGGHDIAVVITKNALPRTALPMNRTPLTNNDIGTTIRLVGYGITSGRDTQGTSAGTKRQTTTTLYDYDNLLLYFNDPKHLTCEGDSGGPAFITRNGVEYIAGVTSFGDQGCMYEGADTRVDIFTSFVDPYIAQFDGQQQPMPDLAMAPPADMARPVSRDMAQVSPGQDAAAPPMPGEVGAVCMAHTDCNSRTCAFTSDTSGYCTQMCDPADTTTCPAGYYCGLIDSAYYCQRSGGFTGGRSGCSIGSGGSGGIGGGDMLSGLAAIGLVLGAMLRLHKRRA